MWEPRYHSHSVEPSPLKGRKMLAILALVCGLVGMIGVLFSEIRLFVAIGLLGVVLLAARLVLNLL